MRAESDGEPARFLLSPVLGSKEVPTTVWEDARLWGVRSSSDAGVRNARHSRSNGCDNQERSPTEIQYTPSNSNDAEVPKPQSEDPSEACCVDCQATQACKGDETGRILIEPFLCPPKKSIQEARDEGGRRIRELGRLRHDCDCRRKLKRHKPIALIQGTSALPPYDPPTRPPRHGILSTPTSCILEACFDIFHPVEIETATKEQPQSGLTIPAARILRSQRYSESCTPGRCDRHLSLSRTTQWYFSSQRVSSST